MKKFIKDLINDDSLIAKWCAGGILLLSAVIIYIIIDIIFNSPSAIIIVLGVIFSITVLPILVGKFLSWFINKIDKWTSD